MSLATRGRYVGGGGGGGGGDDRVGGSGQPRRARGSGALPPCEEQAALSSETTRARPPWRGDAGRGRRPSHQGNRARPVYLTAARFTQQARVPNPRFVLLRAAARLQAVVTRSVVIINVVVLNLAHPCAWQRLPRIYSQKKFWKFPERASGTAFPWFP
jgi:hypothetical protein